jgi:hypothetical protein
MRQISHSITDNLEANDEEESPGHVKVKDDLQKETTPANQENRVEVQVTYRVPTTQVGYWQNFVRDLLNGMIQN